MLDAIDFVDKKSPPHGQNQEKEKTQTTEMYILLSNFFQRKIKFFGFQVQKFHVKITKQAIPAFPYNLTISSSWIEDWNCTIWKKNSLAG